MPAEAMVNKEIPGSINKNLYPLFHRQNFVYYKEIKALILLSLEV